MFSLEESATPLGHEMRKYFSFAPGYRNLNHGSFGTFPMAIRQKADELRTQCEERPCAFLKYQYDVLLEESRAAMAAFLNVPVSTIVFVMNATTGVNTVLRNLDWCDSDEIIQLDVIYGACGKSTEYVCESNNDHVRTREVCVHYPVEDDHLVSAFRDAIHASRRAGRTPRIAIFDTVCSNPGIRLPFEALTALCRAEGVLSLIDAAHGVGHVALDLAALDPDFLVSNCHKWLFTPRGCAVFYVPHRNQAMMRSTLPTSNGFVPRSARDPTSDDPTDFVRNFAFVGTFDNIPFLTVPAAIAWRHHVCGGESRIRAYCTNLAREGGRRVAEILGTTVLDNATHTHTDCCLVNVRLPIQAGYSVRLTWKGEPATPTDWMQKTLIEDYHTFLPVFPFQDEWWVRLSGQIYLEMSDFEWAGHTLVELCRRFQDALSNVD
ncbi:hypothetical protein EYZ11_008091 [Aspergillus tanneri]|uniref:Aminotransferase class V domain-containing protein n=1 Tax=Aspergillus tanneri TaxID=1220188 RepID=A0A4S3JBD1_9EURO|nr:uncharacterized protein ATNIH1004_002130 [Aspergillus tanneri]KAA8649459.1 hypothetical protein ATNIH1004_002130 [Aspergillus tanneri]THC92449.1 hypothetical protein EYZ11_008091 [Aspergillus tanneri]